MRPTPKDVIHEWDSENDPPPQTGWVIVICCVAVLLAVLLSPLLEDWL